MDDFIGFSFNGITSDDLGILRVSDGDRYNIDLLPPTRDLITEVPGGHGSYYFGSTFGEREFSIPIAFDSLTEEQLRILRQTFAIDTIGDLIFSEAPYKIYSAKIVNSSLSFVCFQNGLDRVYKGEGGIDFICYSPFARSRYKYLEDYYTDPDSDLLLNIDEWKDSSRIIPKEKGVGTPYTLVEELSGLNYGMYYDTFYMTDTNHYNPVGYHESEAEMKAMTAYLYNGGDLPVDYQLSICFSKNTIGGESTWMVKINSLVDPYPTLYSLVFYLPKNSSETIVKIDTKKRLLTFNGEILNKQIKSGDFFKLPIGACRMTISSIDEPGHGIFLLDEITTGLNIGNTEIQYDYLYY